MCTTSEKTLVAPLLGLPSNQWSPPACVPRLGRRADRAGRCCLPARRCDPSCWPCIRLTCGPVSSSTPTALQGQPGLARQQRPDKLPRLQLHRSRSGCIQVGHEQTQPLTAGLRDVGSWQHSAATSACRPLCLLHHVLARPCRAPAAPPDPAAYRCRLTCLPNPRCPTQWP